MDLSFLYYTPLSDLGDIQFRQSVFRDLLYPDTRKLLDTFSSKICALAVQLDSAKDTLRSESSSQNNYLLYGHFLDYAEHYCKDLDQFETSLQDLNPSSEGLCHSIQSIEELYHSKFYQDLHQTLMTLREDFNRERYCMLIKNDTIHVKKYNGESNLSEKITDVFKKFQVEDSKNYLQSLSETPYANYIEGEVLQCLSRVYPELFKRLTSFIHQFSDFMDPGLLQFCKELRFYFSWLDQIELLEECGLPFCFPEFGTTDLFANGFFDIVLAKKIPKQIVKNDFRFRPPEKILVITGPNQGGKTTFARAVGQIHYLASLGLSVPGTSACLLPTDHILTHFEREEFLRNQSGKLEDDLTRLYDLLKCSTDRSLIIINEIFASTVLEDALKLGKHMMEELILKGSVCVIVTFLDQLADYSKETVSMVSTVDRTCPDKRTFQVVRKPPDGLAYAMTLAEKHGLTYEQILRRITS